MWVGLLGRRNLLRFAAVVTILSTTWAWQNFTTCGERPRAVSTRIVGGEAVNEGDWPWMAKTWRNHPDSEDGRARCGASLIHEEWILTAAHCIHVLNKPSLHYHVFGTNTTKVEEFSKNVQIRGVSEIYMHPNYTTWRAETIDWDIVVMKLEEPVVLNDFVQPVCLPTKSMTEDTFKPGQDSTITGWGTTEEGGAQNDYLFEVTVPIVSDAACQEYYADEDISERMICAGLEKGGKDSCQGDSGGPMVSELTSDEWQTRWFQPGIVSWGYGCARPEYPGVYTRVSAFEDWLTPIFENGTGPTEKYGDNGCAMDEFMCKGLRCYSHASRCDDSTSCYYGHDEYECGTYAKFFDPMPAKKLENPVVSFDVDDDEECANHCIKRTTFECFAFDTELISEGNRQCYLGDENFVTVDIDPDDNPDHMHYQLLKPNAYGVTEMNFDQRHNFLVTPRWMLERDPSGSSWFIWNIQPQTPENRYNSIQFNFVGIRSITDTDVQCTEAQYMNMVIIRSGVDVSSTVAAAFCLHELPDTFRVMSPMARVEFYSTDTTKYGFLGEYNANWYCDDTRTTSPGTVTSPNYPSNYPARAQCQTLVQAPEGVRIQLNITKMLLETSDEDEKECFDSLTVYDGPDSSARVLKKFCTNESASYFHEATSSSNSLYFKFNSDYAVQRQGFVADYTFLTGPTREDILDATLTNFKYGMTAMGIFFFCLTMVFIVSIVTITSRESSERLQIAKLKHKQSLIGVVIPKVVDDNIDYDKPSTSQGGSASSVSQVASGDYEVKEVNEVEGKTNPAYNMKE